MVRCVDYAVVGGFKQIGKFAVVLGVMYLAAALIELLGVASCFTARIAIIRVYAFGSILSALLLVAGSLISVIVHFTQKNEILNACQQLVTNSTLDVSFGWFGPSTSETLSPADAKNFCQNGWDHESWSSILVVIAEIFLGAVFSLIAFTYYRQCLDPTSAANAFRAPSNQMRAQAGGAYPGHYNPPYGTTPYGTALPNLSYDAPFQPPSGPPPQFAPMMQSEEDLGKPPMYTGEGYSGLDKGGKEDPFADFEGKDRKHGDEHDEFHA
ncbi:hypothetical protein HWV62_41493 [Athelia sp. TMB]|nr:hypothetical protein HWV62_41493 [Athelia sp. TMB]